MYGALAKQMYSNALLDPMPVAPFLNLSYSQIVQGVSSFNLPKWSRTDRSYYSDSHHMCADSSLSSITSHLPNDIPGIRLRPGF